MPLISLLGIVINVLITPSKATNIGKINDGYCGICMNTPAPEIIQHANATYKNLYMPVTSLVIFTGN